MRRIELIFRILVMVMVSSALHAGEPGYEFLRVSMSPAATGMGDAFHARYGDASAVFLNPAGTGRLENGEASAGYVRYLQGVQSGYALYARPISGVGNVGGGLVYFDYGSFDGYDQLGNPAKGYSAWDMSLFAFISRPLDDRTVAGLSVKYVHSGIDRYRSTAMAIDFGTIYEPQEGVLLGLSLQNLGTVTDAFDQRKERLPLSLNIGASKSFSEAVIAEIDFHEMNRQGNFFARWSVGAEWKPMEYLAVRAGYSNYNRQDFSGGDGAAGSLGGLGFGLGFTFDEYVFDYSAVSQGTGIVNRFSIRMTL